MKDIVDREFGDVFISDYIFDEVATGFLKSAGITETVKICSALLNSTYMVNLDEGLFRKSFDMFKKQKDTLLSFTDCANIVLMVERGIKNLAAFDEDFKHVNNINLVNM